MAPGVFAFHARATATKQRSRNSLRSCYLLRLTVSPFRVVFSSCSLARSRWPAATRKRSKPASNPAAAPASSAAAPTKDKSFLVGFIYVGPKDDYGYNQAHAEGAAALSQAARA